MGIWPEGSGGRMGWGLKKGPHSNVHYFFFWISQIVRKLKTLEVYKEQLFREAGVGVALIRNTTWKCGRVDREIIRFLRDKFRFETSIKDLFAHFELVGVSSDLPDAIRRLENRGILKIRK